MKQFLKKNAKRLVVAVVGTTVLILGAIMIITPGPGWVTVFLGLGILATEFAWAERLLTRCKDHAVAARDKVMRKNKPASAIEGATLVPPADGLAPTGQPQP